MADMSSLEVEVDVSESNIERITPGQSCEITLDAYPDKRYKGVVSKIVPTADRTKATVMTKVQFTDLDARVLPEMSAKVAFLSADVDASKIAAAMKPALAVAAIVKMDGKQYVFTVKDQVLARKEVQTGETIGTMIEITSGLSVGEKVVLHPDAALKNGATVKVVEGGK
jgi:multidrug efflux pump subunit AcrA (membrane-fusion protein)